MNYCDADKNKNPKCPVCFPQHKSNKLDWSSARKGSIVKFRCGGEAKLAAPPLPNHVNGNFLTYIENYNHWYMSDGRYHRDGESPFDIIEIIPPKEEESPVKLGKDYYVSFPETDIPNEMHASLVDIFAKASESKSSYESILEQLEGIK